jgi:amino acid adenylation domain-containing protein
MHSRVDEPAFREFSKDDIEQSIPARFGAQVAAYPDRIAVSCGGAALTYRELNRRANALAHAILDRRGSGNEAVALLLPQGTDLVTAILGVLKAGKFYLGLDAGYPPARLVAMVGDVRAGLVVTSTEHRDAAASLVPSGDAVLLAGDFVTAKDPGEPATRVSPGDLAYVFFTSGSTGRPKGVIDSHRNVLHNVMRYTNTLRIGPTDRMTLLQSASFSGSVSSLFGAILNGACTCPIDPRSQGSEQLSRWLKDERITIYHSVPALFRRVLTGGGHFPDVRIVRLEGDQAATSDLQLFARHFPAGARLVNGLGTTETGLVRQFFASGTDDVPGGLLPVGYAVQDMEVSILDPDHHPLPPGELGEIGVRSRYLAVGYWQNPALTAQRFLGDGTGREARVYLTGDLGRLRGDGCLEHLGRNDSRIKLRGQTIELVEIESALRDLPAVSEAAVVLDTSLEISRLVAYYVPATGHAPSVTDLRRELSRRLPGFMVPALFMPLRALPYNENGKLDRNALPAPGTQRPDLSTVYAGPRNLVEHQLTRIWEEVLKVMPVGVNDDFFELGGDSLGAMTMLTQVQEELGLDLPPSLLLSGATIGSIATRIADDHTPPAVPVVEVQRGSGPPRFFYLHGDYLSGGLYCRRLAHEMGTDVAFYALPPCGRNGAEAPLSFVEMAERHLEALRAVQPKGPYFLGGTCNGGLLAYEMARRLVADGEQVSLLALYAASASNLRFRGLDRAVGGVCRLLGYSASHQHAIFLRLREILIRLAGRGPLGLLWHALRKSVLLPREVVRLAGERRSSQPGRDLRAHYLAAEQAYVPAPYPGPVLLLWPQGEPETAEEAAGWWRRLAASVEVKSLPGTHQDCLTSDVRILAREIADSLRLASGASPAAR